MTLPKDKKIEHEHIESMKIAVDHPGNWKVLQNIWFNKQDKMEEFAEYLVQKARTQNKWHRAP